MTDQSSSLPTSTNANPPSHGDPSKDTSIPAPSQPSTSSHPTSHKLDPTATNFTADHAAGPQRGQPASAPSSAAELASAKATLKSALRQFPDFPSPGILFEDIMPIFADLDLHETLIRTLELHVLGAFGGVKPDVVVGLEARGFLFGPSLALRLGSGFVPVRKKGKLPGETVTATYKKEYGEDLFQMQADGVKKGQKVLVVDDIIATGGSAAAAGDLIRKLEGDLLGYMFLMELDFLKGRDKLDAPVFTILSSQ